MSTKIVALGSFLRKEYFSVEGCYDSKNQKKIKIMTQRIKLGIKFLEKFPVSEKGPWFTKKVNKM